MSMMKNVLIVPTAAGPNLLCTSICSWRPGPNYRFSVQQPHGGAAPSHVMPGVHMAPASGNMGWIQLTHGHHHIGIHCPAQPPRSWRSELGPSHSRSQQQSSELITKSSI